MVPDGTRIAFVSNRGDYFSNLFVMRADGSRQAQLTREPNGAGGYRWSPDGTRLVYVGYNIGKEEVAVIHPDGSGLIRLTAGRSPAWSPDGRSIAFESDRTGSYEVYVMNSDGGDLRQLTRSRPHGEQYGWAGRPAWSPDGKRIAFEAYRQGNYEIAVMDISSDEERRVTSDSADDRSPQWSPDGLRLAFLRGHDDSGATKWELWVTRPDGSEQIRLTPGTCDGYLGFSWSPDGRQLAFARGCHAESAEGVWIVNADGSGSRQLVEGRTYDPEWSPRRLH